MLDKKNNIIHLLSLCVLCVSFLLCRYMFFDIHGMKQLPVLLFGFGLVSLLISYFLKGKVTPLFTSFAYIVGFVAGMIFQTDGVDPSGARTNNLWIIWTTVFVCLILIGIISEKIISSNRKLTQ